MSASRRRTGTPTARPAREPAAGRCGRFAAAGEGRTGGGGRQAKRVGVLGQGYVGLPVAIRVNRRAAVVIPVDYDGFGLDMVAATATYVLDTRHCVPGKAVEHL